MDMSEIYNDPTILAFLRSSGLAEQVAANDVARRQTAINQALGIGIEDLNQKGEISRRNIGNSYEDRGVYRSGANLRDQAEQEAQQARQQGALQFQARDDMNNLSGGLTSMIAENQQKAAEMGTQAYMDNALSAGRDAIDNKYLDYGDE